MNRDISSNSSVAELVEVRAGGLAAGALSQVHQVDDVGVEEATAPRSDLEATKNLT